MVRIFTRHPSVKTPRERISSHVINTKTLILEEKITHNSRAIN